MFFTKICLYVYTGHTIKAFVEFEEMVFSLSLAATNMFVLAMYIFKC